jgi:uncharacterized protein (DUF305 family)
MRSAAAATTAAFTIVLAAGFLASCSGSEQHPATPSTQKSSEATDHNADDIAFSRNMVAHHQQAVQMAQMVPTNTSNQQVIALANQVIASEVPETQAFRAWLMQWEDSEGSDPAGQDSHDVPMTGMVDKATMDKLQSVSGAQFDRLWLTSMIDHHRGAIAMAQDEVAHGRNADVLYLARSIIARQQAEIDWMTKMLGG